MNTIRQWPQAWGLAVLLSCLTLAPAAQAAPVTLEFSGTIFSVTDASHVFVTTFPPPSTYSLFVTWDPDLLPGMPAGQFTTATAYQSGPGETSITFSFLSAAGDFFTSDNSFPVRIVVDNTPPLDPTKPPGTTGSDRFSIAGMFAPNLKLSLALLESPGKNPLSSNDLPTTAFGSGPGTWMVSELDVDRTDAIFANISGSVANIEQVTTVPEPSTLTLCSIGVLALGAWCRTRRASAL